MGMFTVGKPIKGVNHVETLVDYVSTIQSKKTTPKSTYYHLAKATNQIPPLLVNKRKEIKNKFFSKYIKHS